MKPSDFIGILVAVGLLGAGALVVGQSRVSPQLILSGIRAFAATVLRGL